MAISLVNMVACGVNTAQIPQFQMGAEKPKSGDLKLPMQQQMPARLQVLDLNLPASVEPLDLNLPAPVEDDFDAGNYNNLSGNPVGSHGASYAQTHSTPYS